MNELSHVDPEGGARMVDVGAKPPQRRTARASGTIAVAPATRELIRQSRLRKGDVFTVAQIAGIQAAKRTSELIPLCHPLSLTHCAVDFAIPPSRDRVVITASAAITAPTGVEMEALTAVSIAALAIYDMCKAADRSMLITGIKLVSKTKTAPPCK